MGVLGGCTTTSRCSGAGSGEKKGAGGTGRITVNRRMTNE